MRGFLVGLALVGTVAFAQAPTGKDVNGFALAPKVPKDRVLIVPASAVKLAQSRKPGYGTSLFDGGTFGASGLKRLDADEGPVRHALHTEVYVIQSGAGTYTSGGTLEGPLEEHPGTPDAMFGKSIKGGETHSVKAGDIIVIPPNVPHQFTKIDSPVTYINVKFEVGK